MTRKILILATLAAFGAAVALAVPSTGRATGWGDLAGLGYGVTVVSTDPTCADGVVVSAITGYGPGTAAATFGCSLDDGFQARVDDFVASTCHIAVFSQTSAPCASAPAPTTTETTTTEPAPPATTTTTADAPAPAPTTTDTTTTTATAAPSIDSAASAPTAHEITDADLQSQIDELRAEVAALEARTTTIEDYLAAGGFVTDTVSSAYVEQQQALGG